MPIHHKDLPKGTLMSILREAGISKKELDETGKKDKNERENPGC